VDQLAVIGTEAYHHVLVTWLEHVWLVDHLILELFTGSTNLRDLHTFGALSSYALGNAVSKYEAIKHGLAFAVVMVMMLVASMMVMLVLDFCAGSAGCQQQSNGDECDLLHD